MRFLPQLLIKNKGCVESLSLIPLRFVDGKHSMDEISAELGLSRSDIEGYVQRSISK